jgi:uncharacterized protein
MPQETYAAKQASAEAEPSGSDPLAGVKDSLNKVYDSKPYAEFREKSNSFFSSIYGIIFAGAFIGVVAAFLQHEGNPGNMGFCMACFERDIAGSLGLFAKGPAYMRPEIPGIILGAFAASLMFKEYKAKTGSAPSIRFILGFFSMIGALVFLGCPWRAFLRLAGGDWNAIIGIAGLTVGVFIGSFFLKNGFNLGKAEKVRPAVGLLLPFIAILLMILVIAKPVFDEGQIDPDSGASIEVFVLKETAGHAAIWISFGVAFFVGFLAQRTRFCTIGGLRDSIMIQDYHLLMGVIALVVAAFITNQIFDAFFDGLPQWNPGWDGQPAAMPSEFYTWNFLGMVLAGFGFTLAGGCPGRQLVLSGEGNADSSIFVVGMVAGAAFAHNFRLSSSPVGPGDWGPAAVIIGLIIFVIIGLMMRDRH